MAADHRTDADGLTANEREAVKHLRQVVPGHGVVGTIKGKNDSVNG